ncbi:MAG: hypothetical protein JL50_12160 [Peptococcaceae bacterium BICA1-7]|nr:MAG: hypothetical protein JL50_12160 [Peptococcaceae bacterium BICA1-7]HBV98878.1 hypothetical protein [Desulfotomaculum sp.]
MEFQWDRDRIILLSSIIVSIAVAYPILKVDWKRYGLLFIMTGVIGNILCYMFVKLGFYSFPRVLFPHIVQMPFFTVLTVFPFIVIAGVRYSPAAWAWKIPFYWAVVHLGMTAETLAMLNTKLIVYHSPWDFWDSYTWWWIFLLLFEWVGGLIIPADRRKPLNISLFSYGKSVFAVFHFIVIVTIFLGGYYLGITARH